MSDSSEPSQSSGPSQSSEPSQTALTAAAARAAHLLVDNPPVIFTDTLASALLGDRAEELISYHRLHGEHVVLAGARGQVVCRNRYAEDALAAAAGRGTGQYVILGAGLDSFAYRSPLAERLAVFEVDRHATQEAKRRQLASAGIAVPVTVRFVSSDFESGSLTELLVAAGFDPSRPAFVSWLGVTMYLSESAIAATLAEVGRFAAGSEVVCDYVLPAPLRDEAGNVYADLVGPVAAERGEPWRSALAPDRMSALLATAGLTPLRHVAQRDIGEPGTWDRSDALRPVTFSLLAHAVAGRPGG